MPFVVWRWTAEKPALGRRRRLARGSVLRRSRTLEQLLVDGRHGRVSRHEQLALVSKRPARLIESERLKCVPGLKKDALELRDPLLQSSKVFSRIGLKILGHLTQALSAYI